MAKTYVGDVNKRLRLDTKVDISGSTTKQIKYKRPDGTTGNWTAVIVDGQKLKITSDANTWDQNGNWLYQAYVNDKPLGETVAHRIYAAFE